MNFQRIVLPIAGVAFVAFAWSAYGWSGVALAVGGIVMWMLLHFTRLTITLRKAADRPIGYVGSAVMINVRLKPKMTLLHVIGLTRSLGEQLSEKDVQPEVYRWTDPGDVTLTCEFLEGKLVKWTLQRPPETPDTPEPPAAEAGGAPR